MSTGIITTAILLIAGYAIVSRLIGLAFRLVVPAVLVAILVSAGVFSNLMPDRSSADPYDHDRNSLEGENRLGDLRLRDLPEIAVDTVRSVLRGTLALLDGVSEPEPIKQQRLFPEPRRPSRDRFDEAPPPPYDEPSWHQPPRSWRP